jgi:DNA-directed RNA polymerase subunit E'/Rpb7
MDKYDYAYRILMHQRIYLYPNELNSEMDQTIEKRMLDFEGRCNNLGYVFPNSTTLVERRMGKISSANSDGGKIEFEVSFQVAILNPKTNHLIPCRIEEINKIGILAVGGLFDKNGKQSPPLYITIMKQNHEDISVFRDHKKGDHIVIKVLSTRCQLKDKIIRVSGHFEKNIDQQEFEAHQMYMRNKLFIK